MKNSIRISFKELTGTNYKLEGKTTKFSVFSINQPNEIPLEGYTGKGYKKILHFF